MPDASQSWSQTIDSLYTSTWAKRKTKATEQAFLKTPFIYWLRSKNRIEQISGFSRIEIPLEYGTNDTVRWITKGSTVPINDNELLTMAYEDWKTVSVTIPRYMQDDKVNRGKAQIISLIDTKIGAAERALWEEFERVMFADGTGALEPNGLQNIVTTTPTTGTLHGINRATSTNTWWRNQQQDPQGSFAVYGPQDMRNCLNDITKYSGMEQGDIALVTNQTIFEWYEDLLMDMKSLQNTMMADAGFETIQFKGKPLMWCPSAPDGNIYFLCTQYLKFVCDAEYWMEMTDWKEIPNQPFDKVAQIVCNGNMVCSRPIVQKVLSGITA